MSPEDFKRRTFDYAVRVVRLVDALPKKDIARDLGRQLLRAATSVGANYRAAARARSRADFIAKLGIVEEECDESLCWMALLIELNLTKENRLQPLYSEGSEILAMTVSSITTARRPKPLRVHRRAGDLPGKVKTTPFPSSNPPSTIRAKLNR